MSTYPLRSLDEFAWRYNHRAEEEPMFTTLIRNAAASH
jgi:hypothetical protein